MIKRLIERPIAVSMSLIAIIVLGLVSMNFIPVSLMPDIDIPTITVSVSSPGSSAREIDRNILKQLKSQLMQVVGLRDITSEARSDAGTIRMTFEPGNDLDMIFIGVNEKMDRAMAGLPKDVERPKVIKASATDIPAFYLNVTLKTEVISELDYLPNAGNRFSELSTFARDVLSKRIEQLPQTAMVDVSGTITPELLVVPDYQKLNSMNVGVELLESAIKSNNLTLGALSIRDGQYRFNIHFDSRITCKEDIENIYIKHDGRIFRFKELAEITERPGVRNGMVRSDDKNAVTMAIIKQVDARMEELQESIGELLTQLEKEYPTVDFTLTRDQTKLLTFSIDNLKSNLWIGAILACLVVFLFMRDLRTPLLIIMTIPISLIITLLAFHLIGLTINIISLSGLVLGMGMMVDNSIIVIDYISQRWDRGEPLKQAIPKAVSGVFPPMLSSVLTTCSVFIPLIFLSGVSGALFYDQAMGVTIALFSSLLVSTLVIPVYYYLMYGKKAKREENRFLSRFSGVGYYRYYEHGLKWVMRHQKLMWCVFLITIPLTLLVYSNIEKTRLPDIKHDDTLLTIDWNSGISVDENDRRVAELMREIKPYTQQVTSMIGAQQFLLSHTKDITPSESVIYIKANSNEELEQVEERIHEVIKTRYPKGVATFTVSGNIFDMIFSENESKLVVMLQNKSSDAPETDEVIRITDRIRDTLTGVYIAPMVMEQNIRYITDPEALARYGVDYGQIYSKLGSILSQNVLFKINQGGYSVPVTTGESQRQTSDILSSKVRNKDGIEIPLSLLIRETKDEDFKKIFSGNGGDYYPIHIEADDRDVPKIIDAINNIVYDDEVFRADYGGGYFTGRTMVNELMMILAVSILLLYFILASQFESIIQPVIILSEVIIDILFVLLVLFLLGESLNIMSLIGIVVMSGIVINDSILKVDTINRLRKEGYSVLRAVMTAGRDRLKPILMTSLTTILAIAPFLNRVDMGSDLQYPLSLTIIVGMSIGTVVSLFFIPLAYYNIYKRGDKR